MIQLIPQNICTFVLLNWGATKMAEMIPTEPGQVMLLREMSVEAMQQILTGFELFLVQMQQICCNVFRYFMSGIVIYKIKQINPLFAV